MNRLYCEDCERSLEASNEKEEVAKFAKDPTYIPEFVFHHDEFMDHGNEGQGTVVHFLH